MADGFMSIYQTFIYVQTSGLCSLVSKGFLINQKKKILDS